MTFLIAAPAQRATLFAALSAALLLTFAAPAPAQTAPDCGPGPEMLGPDSPEALIATAVQVAKNGDGIDGPSAQAVCIADCWDGSSVTCSGSSCNATDSNCSAGRRGSCWGSSTGTLYCPPCPGCSVSTTCPDGTPLSCQGTECTGGEGTCFVRCDGVYQWCPGHEGEILCVAP